MLEHIESESNGKGAQVDSQPSCNERYVTQTVFMCITLLKKGHWEIKDDFIYGRINGGDFTFAQLDWSGFAKG